MADGVCVERHCKCTLLLPQAHGVGHTALELPGKARWALASPAPDAPADRRLQ
jgi:hypothetical protein